MKPKIDNKKTIPAKSSRKDIDNIRAGLGSDAIAKALIDNLHYLQAKLRVFDTATKNDWYMALAYTVRDRILDRYVKPIEESFGSLSSVKGVAYFSAEFLVGPHLGNGLINLGIWGEVQEAVSKIGQDLGALLEQEQEPGLGNGGLGRLAACYMDSLATLNVPAVGYGIRYEFGIFNQRIRNGWQVESADKWLQFGNPWEIIRPEVSFPVKFGGHTEPYQDGQGHYRVRWAPEEVVKGIACDTFIPGYHSPAGSMLRLWKAEAVESFDFEQFSHGDYYRAVDQKIISETITKVLYPNDEPEIGKLLRLAQQYFFVSCSLQDMIRVHLIRGKKLNEFHIYWAAQLNDTHPAIAVAELMRLLMDEHLMDWEEAWAITQKTFAYTNHTLLPEALEKWPLSLFSKTLPRHLEIIYEINRRFLYEVRSLYPGDEGLVGRLSLIDETGERYVRMAHLACIGSHMINGVAELHTELLKETVLRDFYTITPDKFVNVTNGVTPRRWVVLSNRKLSDLITSTIGERWITNMENELVLLEPFADDPGFQHEWQVVKAKNKRLLASFIKEQTGIIVDPLSLFDVQVKRIHEYKRQHLNVLHVITLYNRIKRGSCAVTTPRTVIFGGKAAPGYFMAKLIIKLITSVAGVINNDPVVSDVLKVVFLPDFNVKNSQRICPAVDLSEQISIAGKEASGTGNMKFAMNGALTIGTLDGANVEIRDAVKQENFFLFGMDVDEVAQRKADGYHPLSIYETNPELRETVDLIASGYFSGGDRELFRPLTESLLNYDEYMLFADYQPYIDCQRRVCEAYRDQKNWTRMSILNTARVGRFSSDRAIREYCSAIWNVSSVRTGKGE